MKVLKRISQRFKSAAWIIAWNLYYFTLLAILLIMINVKELLIVRHNDKVIDYWPGTGKFIDRATGNGKRGIRALLKYLRNVNS